VPSEKDELGVPHVHDPRLDVNEFELTPAGRREVNDGRDARDMGPETYSTPTRAVYEPDSNVVETTEETTLGGFADD